MKLPEQSYRDVLERITTKSSSADCTDAQLVKVLDEFRRLGWKPKSAGRAPVSQNPQVRMVYAIWGDIRPLLDGVAGDGELRAFVQRQTKSPECPDGISAPEFLDAAQAQKVIHGLKGWRTRLRMGRGT